MKYKNAAAKPDAAEFLQDFITHKILEKIKLYFFRLPFTIYGKENAMKEVRHE